MTRLLLAAWLASAAFACDPNHNWSPISDSHRQVLTQRAAEALVRTALSQMQPPLSPGEKIAVVEAVDVSPASTRGVSGTAGFLAGLAATLVSSQAVLSAGPERVAVELARSGLGPDAIYGPAFFERLGAATGATLFVKARLVDYDVAVHRLTDLNPANKGLEATQVAEQAKARISVQDRSGRYRLIDELDGAALQSFIYFTNPAGPFSAVEVLMERPLTQALRWTPRPGHEHFDF